MEQIVDTKFAQLRQHMINSITSKHDAQVYMKRELV